MVKSNSDVHINSTIDLPDKGRPGTLYVKVLEQPTETGKINSGITSKGNPWAHCKVSFTEQKIENDGKVFSVAHSLTVNGFDGMAEIMTDGDRIEGEDVHYFKAGNRLKLRGYMKPNSFIGSNGDQIDNIKFEVQAVAFDQP
mgnify:CR=1 FL=1